MSRLRAISILIALGTAGCAKESNDSERDVDASASTTNAFDADRIYLATWISSSPDFTPLEGVEMCDDASGRCVESDSRGAAVLDGLRPQTEMILTYRLEGYRSSIQALVTPRFSTSVSLGMLMTSLATERAQLEMARQLLREAGRPELDLTAERMDSLAQIEFGADGEQGYGFYSSISAALDPASGDGPFYLLFPARKVALEIKDDELAFSALFVNVEPRDEGYEIVYTRSSGPSCTFYDGQYGGWPSRTGSLNAHHVPVRAGHITWFTHAFCSSEGASP